MKPRFTFVLLPFSCKFCLKAFSLVSFSIKVVPEIAQNKLPDINCLKQQHHNKQTNKRDQLQMKEDVEANKLNHQMQLI